MFVVAPAFAGAKGVKPEGAEVAAPMFIGFAFIVFPFLAVRPWRENAGSG
jgi:hypothetical protein